MRVCTKMLKTHRCQASHWSNIDYHTTCFWILFEYWQAHLRTQYRSHQIQFNIVSPENAMFYSCARIIDHNWEKRQTSKVVSKLKNWASASWRAAGVFIVLRSTNPYYLCDSLPLGERTLERNKFLVKYANNSCWNLKNQTNLKFKNQTNFTTWQYDIYDI